MPPRTAVRPKSNRPVSAIYLGSNPQIANNTGAVAGSVQSLQSSYSTIGTPPGLPDLPEPPSPGASIGSNDSGLPSPPATNSTGSGSAGDPGSVAIRKRPVSFDGSSSSSPSPSGNIQNMQNGFSSHTRTSSQRSTNGISSRSSSRLAHVQDSDEGENFDDLYDNENGNDPGQEEDHTARLDHRLSINAKSSSENVMALQRVKSLAQRNRMALDKLSSMSRLNSPSPSNSHRRSLTPGTRSPSASHSSKTSSTTSSSRLSRPPRTSMPSSPQDQGLSGSETERESTTHHSTFSSQSSHSQSNSQSSSSYRTSAPSASASVPHLPFQSRHPVAPNSSIPHPPPLRVRQTSAPDSPQKARLRSAASASSGGSNTGHSPTGKRRKRASMASTSALHYTEEYDENESRFSTARDRTHDRDTARGADRDVTKNALAAVASSRRSPLGARRRAALPVEFRLDLGNGEGSSSTVLQPRDESGRRSSLDATFATEPMTPHRFPRTSNGFRRSSTVREPRSAVQGKWTSEDLRSVASSSVRDPAPRTTEGRERRQSLRGGSAESALKLWSPGGRSLIGEGLRAAGLSIRRDERANVDAGADVLVRDRQTERYESMDDERRRGVLRQPPRASTSMAEYRSLDTTDDDVRDRGRDGRREQALRGYKSAYPLTPQDQQREMDNRELGYARREQSTGRREREFGLDRATSSLSRYGTPSMHSTTAATTAQPHDRYANSFGSRRFSAQTPVSGTSQTAATPQNHAEHTQLMLESLNMFEANLAKIGQLSVSGSGTGGGSSQAELSRNAQSIVFAAERLNGLLRNGTNRALEAQIDAEVDDEDEIGRGREIGEVWRRVGGEYREGLRAADELVRGVTGLLLGVGKVMRDFSALGGGEIGSPGLHARSVSLGDEDALLRRGSPDVGGSATGSGRRSADSRRSWEAGGTGQVREKDREKEREETLRRLAGGRADSALGVLRSSPAYQALRERGRLDSMFETPPPRGHVKNTIGPDSSSRRLFTPREQREQLLDAMHAKAMATSDAQQVLYASNYEPSPTPAMRAKDTNPDRNHTLPPISIPRPLPTLPSESSLRRNATPADRTGSIRDRNDRHKFSVSISTVRPGPSFPVLTAGRATTAITPHTVSNSPERMNFPLNRTDSGQSGLSGRSQVTFSRPSTISVSALNGLQQQDSERNRRMSNMSSQIEPSISIPVDPVTPLSGSETERDTRRKTLGPRIGMRMSLDSSVTSEMEVKGGTASRILKVHAADRSAASTVLPSLPSGAGRRERRRTVTDIWPRD